MPINNFLLPGAKTTPAYEVANSCRFDRGSSASMHITFSGAGDRQKFTFSFWVKRNKLGTQEVIFDTNFGGGANEHRILFDSSDRLEYYDYASSSTTLKYVTTRVFRDTSAWYSIIIAVDTTQGTAGNRVKIYINGTQETSFGTETQPSENLSTSLNTAVKHQIGVKNVSSNYLDAYLAEFVFISGTQYAASDFGEFDSDSPRIWKPKDVSGLTFGTNGFYLDFEDSSNLGNDANGGTDLTEANIAATDQATDTCTNNFATLNPLENYHAGGTFTQGNTYYTSVSSKHDFAVSTIGMTAGKWYAEFKVHQDTDYNAIGISDHSYQGSNQEISEDNYSYAFVNYDASNSIVRGNGSTILSSMPLFGNGDIVCVAVDITNSKLYFRKNGDAWINSGDPTSGSTGTGAVSIQDLSSVSSSYGQGVYFFGVGLWNTSAAGSYDANFGNPAFAISSSNSDANGYGNFEYSVPSGYLALCTKNLGSDGG